MLAGLLTGNGLIYHRLREYQSQLVDAKARLIATEILMERINDNHSQMRDEIATLRQRLEAIERGEPP